MKKFKYRAKKGTGETVDGELVAENRETAVDKVNTLGLIPVDVEEERTAEDKKRMPKFSSKRVKSEDLLNFYRQLAKLIKSGVPILSALVFAADQSTCVYLRTVLTQVHARVREGQSLSAALGAFPALFSQFDIAMIRMGEALGRLDESLARIAVYRRSQEDLKKKVQGALVYPVFVLLLGIGTVAFILAVVIPQFASFFSDLQQELPLATRLLIGLSRWMQGGGVWILVLIFAVVVAVIKRKKTERQKAVLDRFLLSLPGLGPLVLKFETARLARTWELLTRCGVPILDAVKISMPVAGNDMIRRKIQGCCEAVEQGGTLSEAVRNGGLFPAFVYRLIAVGEESGRLDEVFAEIAEWYEQETTETVRIMTQLLEPVVILVIGSILGMMITAVLLPIFSINAMVQ